MIRLIQGHLMSLLLTIDGEKGEVANRWGAEAMFSCSLDAQAELRTGLVCCSGAMGIDASVWFEDRLPTALEGFAFVRFDLSEVHVIDPDGAALLMRLVNQLKSSDTEVRITGTHPLPMISLLLLRIPQRIGYELFEN